MAIESDRKLETEAQRPRFSVIIPNFNNGATLARALDSLLVQTVPAHEIIVVDDGSRDNSREVAERYGKSIVYIFQDNAGVSAARNRGARAATGDWLAFLDADDIYFPDRLKAHSDWIAAAPEIDFLFGEQEERTPDGRTVALTLRKTRAFKALSGRYGSTGNLLVRQTDFEDLIEDGFSEIRTLSVPRQTFLDMGGFVEGMRICEDVHFIVRLSARSGLAGMVTAPLAVYYLYQTGAIRKNILKTQQEYVRAMANLADELKYTPAPIAAGLKKSLGHARLSLAYAYLRENRKLEAIGSVLPTLRTNPGLRSVRDLLSVIKGFPKASQA